MNSSKTLLCEYKLKMSLKYNSQSGPFGLCSGYWDEKSHLFRLADETEKSDCCLSTCKPLIDKCVELCPKAEAKHRNSCYKSCDDIKEACVSNCKLSSGVFGRSNPIFKGTEAAGCGNGVYKPIDKECAIKNKIKIMNICRNNCTPTSNVECTKHCQYSFDFNTDANTNPLSFTKPSKLLKSPYIKSTHGEGNSVMYIVYALVIFGIIFGIYIIWKLKNSKV
jgi:hypothetical protein